MEPTRQSREWEREAGEEVPAGKAADLGGWRWGRGRWGTLHCAPGSGLADGRAQELLVEGGLRGGTDRSCLFSPR